MEVREAFPLRGKTTMRIGGTAKYFSELKTKEDAEKAMSFAREHTLPLLPLGSGSNTVFSDGEVQALVVQIKHEAVTIDGVKVTVGAGKNLAMLINELGSMGMDLSALTGIPGTIGGAIFGNAGQGPKGVWIDHFIRSVTVLDDGQWKTLPKEECGFSYRESGFKLPATRLPLRSPGAKGGYPLPALIWEAELIVPLGDPQAIKANVQMLLQKRIETQPHLKTAGSCFKGVGGEPAWKLIDAAGLRGLKVGGVEISPKHANFLINTGEASYEDAVTLIDVVKKAIPKALEVEMRCFGEDGQVRF